LLKRFLFRPHDHVRLQIGIHVIEIIAVTGYADQKVAIIFRTFLGSIKRLRIDDIELDVMSAQSEIAADQRRQLGDILLTLQQARQETLVQQRPPALHLVKLAERLDDETETCRPRWHARPSVR